MEHPSEPLHWFHSKENQVALIKNLRILKELDYEPTPDRSRCGEARDGWESNPYPLPVQRGFAFA